MGYEGGSLGDAVAAVRDTTKRTRRDVVDRAARHWREVTRVNTPIETFLKAVGTKPPYHLRWSWELKDLRIFPDPSGDGEIIEGGLYTEVEYAPYVEEGTGLWGPEHKKYLIKPKRPGGWLSWIARDYYVNPKTGKVTKPGDRVFAKQVLHPGSPGNHMVAIGMHMTEAEFETMMRPVMAEWERESERSMVRAWRLGGGS